MRYCLYVLILLVIAATIDDEIRDMQLPTPYLIMENFNFLIDRRVAL